MIDKERNNEIARNYYYRHRELCQERALNYHNKHLKERIVYDRKWREQNRDKIREYNKLHPERNGNSARTPEQWIAHNQARKHCPLASCCELCDSIENLMRHHPDYEFPDIIVTCCASCHSFIHRGVD